MNAEETLKLVILLFAVVNTIILGLQAWYRKDWGMAGSILPRLYFIIALVLYFITDFEFSVIPFYIGLLVVFAGDSLTNMFILISKRFHIELYSLHLLEILKQLQLKYDFIIEHVPVGIYVLDKGGHIEFVNNGFCTLTGYTKTELLGKSVFMLIPEKNKIEIHDRITKRISGAESIADYITEIVTKSGKIIEVHVNAKQTVNGHQTITGCFTPFWR